MRHGAGFICALTIVAGVAHSARAEDLKDLVHRADYVLRGKTTAAVVHMDIHKPSYDRSYSIVYWDDSKDHGDRVLVKILGPAQWRGQGTLKADGKLTVYNPSSDRMTVLSGSMLGESWMGSHFTNDDLVKQTDMARDFVAKEIRAWDGQTTAGAKARYHLIELVPAPRAPVVWPKLQLELYVEGDHVIPTKELFFFRAKDDKPVRTMTFSDVRTLGGRIAPAVITLTVASSSDEYTKLTYDTLKFDTAIPDSKFTEQALRQ
ncbi:MAG: outer membrane lipoprotein-sorting protein [Kofleriaceae bacterium]